jgi:ribonucleoside-diphosphate reductase alpha chain
MLDRVPPPERKPMEQQAIFSLSQHIWDLKYRLRGADGTPVDRSLSDTWHRVAGAAAQAEKPAQRKRWTSRFEQAMADFAFLPAGRILAGAGTGRNVTLFNCFVLGTIGDDMASIFANVTDAALTMQQGGGIGHDFSTLRPKGAPVKGVGADASGPISFMDVWDAMCRTIMSAGQRRGAMMGTMRCDHPDIEDFVAAKADAKRLRNFNLSVLVTDPFISAVKSGSDWPLQFNGKVYKSLPARDLWHRIMRATYDYAEPGVIFIDRINAANNLHYCETIAATNPCGEQPLPPYGACLLGSINLARLIDHPFTPEARLDRARLEELTAVAIRFLDNVIDVSGYPLPAQRKEAQGKRRLGLGITGLADALILSGLHYGSPEARAKAGEWMAAIQNAAYRASADLAAERGSFPLFNADKLLAAPGPGRLEAATRQAVAKSGLRNGLLTSIAPTGTISMLAENVSSGIEPVFGLEFTRKVLSDGGASREIRVEDYAHRLFRDRFGPAVALPAAFVTANDLTPDAHLKMQAALQPHVDSSISKTINCPETISFADFEQIYLKAYDLGLKGCTTFRPNAVTGSILTVTAPPPAGEGVQAALPLPAPVPTQAVAEAHVAPLPRDPVLPGFTYKLRWQGSEHAIYVTINDVIEDGRRRPFEIFINSKNLEHYAWTVALTRMISAVFRRGGDVSFVVEELKAVFDPRGGQWQDGQYVPSLLAAIGGLIEQHMIATGFMRAEPRLTDTVTMQPLSATAIAPVAPIPGARFCPRCQQPSFVMQESCWVCQSCGYSKCG